MKTLSHQRFVRQMAPMLKEAAARAGALAAATDVDAARQAAGGGARLSPELFEALHAADAAWRAAGGHDALVAALEASDPSKWPEIFAASFEHDALQPIKKAVGAHNKKALDDVDLSPVKSIIKQVSIDVELVAAGGFSLVSAIDAEDGRLMTLSAAVKAGLGGDVGLSIGGGLGLSGAGPEDAGGAGVGVEGGAFVGPGFAGEAGVAVDILPSDFWKLIEGPLAFRPKFNPLQWTIVVNAGVGAAIGVDAFAEYGIIFAEKDMPLVVQPEGTRMVRIYAVHCDGRADVGGDRDEIHLEFTPDTNNGTYRYPQQGHFSIASEAKSSKGLYDTWYVGRAVSFNSQFRLKIKDGDDTLASWTVTWPLAPTAKTDSGFTYNYKHKETRDLVNHVNYKVMIQTL